MRTYIAAGALALAITAGAVAPATAAPSANYYDRAADRAQDRYTQAFPITSGMPTPLLDRAMRARARAIVADTYGVSFVANGRARASLRRWAPATLSGVWTVRVTGRKGRTFTETRVSLYHVEDGSVILWRILGGISATSNV